MSKVMRPKKPTLMPPMSIMTWSFIPQQTAFDVLMTFAASHGNFESRKSASRVGGPKSNS